MEKQLEIKIQPNGSITIEALNFKGEGCAAAAQRFIDALGQSVQSSRKNEYYEDEERGNNSQQNKCR
jgi:NifU-like protein involved in Fe-S cluster formation